MSVVQSVLIFIITVAVIIIDIIVVAVLFIVSNDISGVTDVIDNIGIDEYNNDGDDTVITVTKSTVTTIDTANNTPATIFVILVFYNHDRYLK